MVGDQDARLDSRAHLAALDHDDGMRLLGGSGHHRLELVSVRDGVSIEGGDAVAKLKRAGVFLRQVRDQHAGPGIVGLVTEGAQVQRGRGSRGHQGTRQHIVALVDIELAGR